MTAAPGAEVIAAVEQLQAERDELLDLLRTVLVLDDEAIDLPADLIAEIRRRV